MQDMGAVIAQPAHSSRSTCRYLHLYQPHIADLLLQRLAENPNAPLADLLVQINGTQLWRVFSVA